jgi:MinD-like ATPase involved in chromosome partitioning or flagellar assembly
MPLPVRVAIGCPEHESELWAMIDDPHFRVDGRPCAFAGPCASIAELRDMLASGMADVVLVSATLNAIPFETLRDLVTGRRVVVLASDSFSDRWRSFPARVLAASPTRPELAQAFEDALLGRGGAPRSRHASQVQAGSRPGTEAEPGARAAEQPRSELIAVTKAYRGHGVTLTATGLAFAIGVHEPRTILVDANFRAGAVEFSSGANPARNLAQLVRRADEAQQAEPAWDALFESEVQDIGAPSQAHVLCGITRLSQRTQLTESSFRKLIQALRERYRYLVLATSGSGWTADDPPIDQLALQLADRILLVIRPDIEGITLARRALEGWPDRGRIHLVLNEVGLPDQVFSADVEAKLGAPVVARLPFDPWKVAQARARHRPVVCQRGARVATPLVDLAGRIVKGHIELSPDELPTANPWWQRVPLAVTGGLR